MLLGKNNGGLEILGFLGISIGYFAYVFLEVMNR